MLWFCGTRTDHLSRHRIDVPVLMRLEWRSLLDHAADNELGAQGAAALAPELGKLTGLQTLNVAGE